MTEPHKPLFAPGPIAQAPPSEPVPPGAVFKIKRLVSSEDLDRVYAERNRCVAFMAHLAKEAGFNVGTKPDKNEPGWTILFMDIPTGQVSFHFQESELHLLKGLPPYQLFSMEHDKLVAAEWDGHTTEEKYARMERWTKGLYP